MCLSLANVPLAKVGHMDEFRVLVCDNYSWVDIERLLK